jgi:hypothetical protein
LVLGALSAFGWRKSGRTAGFILIPSWLLGRRARPRRGGHAERSGGLAISSPGTARDRSQNFLISIIYRVRATGCLTKEERGRRIISQKKFRLGPVCLDIEPDWQKNNSNYFFSNHLVALSSVLLLSLSFVANNTHEVAVCHADHTRFWTREKAIDVQQSKSCCTTPPHSCPCVLVSCRLSFPSLQCRSPFLIDVCTSRQGTDTLLWCPSHCNMAVTEVHMPPTYTHPPPLPFLSALSTPNTKDQHLCPFRCPVCVCACLPVFICVLVDLFCPPPATPATVLPIPPPIDTSSRIYLIPYFAKCMSSGNVCGNVHKTASVGLAWAENTPPNTLPHARTIAPAPLSMLVLFFVRGCSSNHDPNLHDHSSYNPHTLPSQTPHLQPRATCRSIPLPHQVNVVTKHQNRNPPIKKITPMCAPVTTPPSLH